MAEPRPMSLEELRQRYAAARDAEELRNRLIEDLLQRMSDMQKTMDRNAFVLVLIDGDCMIFLNDLVKQGLSGGDEANRLLRKAVFEYFRYDESFGLDTKIVIRVYANLRGLGKTYVELGVLPNSTAFSEFVLGFNKAHPLCDFIDAGNHKEAADTKLKETLNLYYYDVHCKQIIFGGSADNGYASFLSSFSTDTYVSSRVRILQGPPFSREFQNAIQAGRFKTTSFPTVFRDSFLAKESASYNIPGSMRKTAERATASSGRTSSITTNHWSSKRESTPIGSKGSVRSSEFGARGSTKDSNHGYHTADSGSPSNTTEEILAVTTALADFTRQFLTENPKALDFSSVKKRVEEALGLSHDFWGNNVSNFWFTESKNVIKNAVEEWVEETGNSPPRNATWMRHHPLWPTPVYQSLHAYTKSKPGYLVRSGGQNDTEDWETSGSSIDDAQPLTLADT